MTSIDYSVIIRTTGKAGEKYAKLLSSIDNLVPQPKEVIVVLPEGFELPPEKLGWESFHFCPKGMVRQRLYGVEKCSTPYALITDDDIGFSPDFVQKLYAPIANGSFSITAGPLLEFFPPKGIQTFLWALGAAAAPTVFHKDRYVSVLSSTGFSYNRNINLHENKIYETQSAAWTCFFVDVEQLRGIHFEDELWLDRLEYSAHDDTAMFYKAWLRGLKLGIVSDAVYQHHDGKTSTSGRNVKVEKATGYTRTVFWHRYIYLQSKGLAKFWAVICIWYRMLFQISCDFLRFCAGKRTFEEVKAYIEGIFIALEWIKTDEYKSIPSLI